MASTPKPDAVRKQLSHLLEHAAFRRSRRCTILLRHLVEQSLTDAEFHPKERTLAIEVFGRSPDYDSAADPIVRTTANEIRKRLGAYFHDTGSAAEVYIELPTGSYRPVFRMAAPSQLAAEPAELVPKTPLPPTSPRLRSRAWFVAAGCAAAVLLVVMSAAVLRQHLSQSNADRFWRPFLVSSRRVLVCPPDPNRVIETSSNDNPSSVNVALHTLAPRTPMISMSDSKAVWRVLSVLDKGREATLVRSSDRIQASDLREGPAIIIGGRNNPWSAVVTSGLRFQIVSDGAHSSRIVDQWFPSNRNWIVDSDASPNDGRAYALVSRLISPATENPVVDVAGVGGYATAAAGEFIAEPDYLNSLGSALNGCDNNMQIVLSVSIADGPRSKPRVESIHCW